VDNLAKILEEPFPFGPIDPKALADFEQEVGYALPSDFRAYLLAFNGSRFKKDIYSLSEDGWDADRIHHVYGLHEGPDYFQLLKNWKLYEKYGLHAWKWKLKKFVVFADTGTGEQLAINIKNGSVWLYLHDWEARWFRMPGKFMKIENSFNDFLQKLESEKEHDARMTGDPRYDAFKKQLAEIEAKRDAEVEQGMWD
jgi:hypothetical protein